MEIGTRVRIKRLYGGGYSGATGRIIDSLGEDWLRVRFDTPVKLEGYMYLIAEEIFLLKELEAI